MPGITKRPFRGAPKALPKRITKPLASMGLTLEPGAYVTKEQMEQFVSNVIQDFAVQTAEMMAQTFKENFAIGVRFGLYTKDGLAKLRSAQEAGEDVTEDGPAEPAKVVNIMDTHIQ